METLIKDHGECSLFSDKGHLINQAEICIFNLISAKVGIWQVGHVIEAVMKILERHIHRLPDENTIRNVNGIIS